MRFKDCSDTLKKDKEIIAAAIDNNGLAL